MIFEKVKAYDVSLLVADNTIPEISTWITSKPIIIKSPEVSIKGIVKVHESI